MKSIQIKRGLNIPITGVPEQKITQGKEVKHVALLGDDYVGMKPTMLVKEGDSVKLGDVVFTDKKIPSIKYTAPGSGKVVSINRGEKRVFQSLVIELEETTEEVKFKVYDENQLEAITREEVTEQLLNSGEWVSLRMRPFSKVAEPATVPHSIFVNAMDTNPLAPSIPELLKGSERNLEMGLMILSKLTDGKVYFCKEANSDIKISEKEKVESVEFSGLHPAGLSGTHIHFLDPVNSKKTVWYINAEDVVAMGYLFSTGRIKTEKIVSLGGPQVNSPRLIKTRKGANLIELTEGELKNGNNRVISGSILMGVKAEGAKAYLGKYHRSISVLRESDSRSFLGWVNPFVNQFSLKRVLLSSFNRKKKFDFTTNNNGSLRSIIPYDNFQSVMPLDILPTFLLRSLAVNDVEEAEKLGALELDEEDLALCTFICPSKNDYGIILRRNLTLIEKEG